LSQSYDEVRQLGDHELRELLDSGRPEERVWAIWALALRSTDHVAELARRDEPDAGVRRNLAVVLAGHGELDLLVALARRDPAPEVRAAAMQLVARFALDAKLPSALVIERATSDAPEVRIAVLGVLFEGAPRWLLDLAIGMLDDRDGDVRYEAFEALVRAAEPSRALGWLEEAPEAEARIVLMRWTARSPGGNEKPADRVRACATILAQASRRLRRLLVESVRLATWRDLAPAIGDEPTLIRAFARRDHAAVTEIPTAILLRATLREPDDIWLQLIHRRIAELETPDLELAPLLPDYVELCQKRLHDVDAQLGEVRGRDDIQLEDLEAMDDYRATLAAAIEHAARLAVH
jgi:hypothetical protein